MSSATPDNRSPRPAAVLPPALIAVAHTATTLACAMRRASMPQTVSAHATLVAAELLVVALVARRPNARPVPVQASWSVVALTIALVVAPSVVGARIATLDASPQRAALVFGVIALLQAIASAASLATIAGRGVAPSRDVESVVATPRGFTGEFGVVAGGHVFVSHSSVDRLTVEREIIRPLRERGVNVWYARDDIHPSDDWKHKIVEALAASSWVLAVVSRNAAASEWVQTEVAWALKYARGRVIPVVIDGTSPEEIDPRLISVHYVDFAERTPEDLDRLMQLLSAPPPPTATYTTGSHPTIVS